MCVWCRRCGGGRPLPLKEPEYRGLSRTAGSMARILGRKDPTETKWEAEDRRRQVFERPAEKTEARVGGGGGLV